MPFIVAAVKVAVGAVLAVPSIAANIGAVALTSAGFSAGAAFAISSKAVVFGLVFGGSRLLKAFGKKKHEFSSLQNSGILVTHRGSAEPARIVFGRTRIGGVYYPIGSWGTGGTSNEYLAFAIIWAGHECEAIEKIYFNEEEVPPDGSGGVTGRFKDYVSYSHYLGGTGQVAHADWVTNISDWTNDHTADDICYTAFTFRWNPDLFGQEYNITCLIRGMKHVYTFTGATTEWTNNAALILNHYLTDSTLGAIGVDRATEVDDTQAQAAENDCDEIVTYYPQNTFTTDFATDDKLDATAHGYLDGDGVSVSTTGTLPGGLAADTLYYVTNKTDDDFELLANPWDTAVVDINTSNGSGTHTINKSEYRYRIDGMILSSERPRDVLPQLLAAMAGNLYFVGGQYLYEAGVSKSATITLDEDDIRGPFNVKALLPDQEIFNTVRGLYNSPKNNYQATDFPVFRRWAERAFGAANTFTSDPYFRLLTGHGYEDGDIIRFRGDKAAASTLPTTSPQIVVDRDYYIKDAASATFNISETDGGATITISADGTGTSYLRQENYQKADNWERLYADLSLRFTSSELAAERLSRILLEEARQEITVPMPVRLSGVKLRIGDWVQVDNTEMGWSSKLFKVVDWGLQVYDAPTAGGETAPALGTNLVLRETAAAVYTFDKDVDQTDQDLAPNTTLPDPGSVETPQNPSISSGANDGFFQNDGTYVPRIRVKWDMTTDHFVRGGGSVYVQHRKQDTQNFTVTAGTDRVNITAHGIPDGREVRVITSGADLPEPLDEDTFYFVINGTANDFQLTTIRGDDDAVVDITDAGSGTHSIIYNDWITDIIAGDSTEALIGNVIEGEKYDLRVFFVNSLGIEGNSRNSNGHTVVGESAAPSTPTGLTADDMGGTVAVARWTFPTEIDLAGVEVQTRTDGDPEPWADVGFVAGSPHAGSSNKGFYTEQVQSAEVWRVRIRAVDRKGNASSYTSEVTHTMP